MGDNEYKNWEELFSWSDQSVEGPGDRVEVFRTRAVSSVRLLLSGLTRLTTLLLLGVVELGVPSTSSRLRSSGSGTLLRCASVRESFLLLLSSVAVVGLLEGRVVGRYLLVRLGVVAGEAKQMSSSAR